MPAILPFLAVFPLRLYVPDQPPTAPTSAGAPVLLRAVVTRARRPWRPRVRRVA